MNFLLDTHTFLWFLEGNPILPDKVVKTIENTENLKFVSIASIWEIAIKINLGKLKLDIPLEELKQEILSNNFEILLLGFDHYEYPQFCQ
jgi:PIN domain nuclease of toxin-antitoxin system